MERTTEFVQGNREKALIEPMNGYDHAEFEKWPCKNPPEHDPRSLCHKQLEPPTDNNMDNVNCAKWVYNIFAFTVTDPGLAKALLISGLVIDNNDEQFFISRL